VPNEAGPEEVRATTQAARAPGPEPALARLERQVAAQTAALAQVAPGWPLPQATVELLGAPLPAELDLSQLPPSYLPRLTAVVEHVQGLIEVIELRQRELAGRIAAVRSARRSGPAAHVLDRTG
jgi:hypothetical protein